MPQFKIGDRVIAALQSMPSSPIRGSIIALVPYYGPADMTHKYRVKSDGYGPTFNCSASELEPESK